MTETFFNRASEFPMSSEKCHHSPFPRNFISNCNFIATMIKILRCNFNITSKNNIKYGQANDETKIYFEMTY